MYTHAYERKTHARPRVFPFNPLADQPVQTAERTTRSMPLQRAHSGVPVINTWLRSTRQSAFWRSKGSLLEEADRVHALWREWRVQEQERVDAASRRGKQRVDARPMNTGGGSSTLEYEGGAVISDAEDANADGAEVLHDDAEEGYNNEGVSRPHGRGRGRGGRASRGNGKGARGSQTGKGGTTRAQQLGPYLLYRINIFGEPMGVGETKDSLPTTLSRQAKERICKSAVNVLTEWVQGLIDEWTNAGRNVSLPPLFTNWAVH